MVDAVSYFMVDVEVDGPIPERYSMVAIGAVLVEPGLQPAFYGRLRPISDRLVAHIQTMLPRVRQVIRQTRSRVLRGETRTPGKIVSLFEPWLRSSARGSCTSQRSFGACVKLQEADGGIVTDARISRLKHVFGMKRSRYRGRHGLDRSIYWAAIANNLVAIGRHPRPPPSAACQGGR